MVSEDLLEILRCPACVSDPQRREEEEDPGLLELVRDTWLVCQSPGCGRKYPIKDDIPVMLIDEGDKWVDVPVEELPEPPEFETTSEVTSEAESAPEPEAAPPSPRIESAQPVLRHDYGVLLLLVISVLVILLLLRRSKSSAEPEGGDQ